MVLQTNYEEEFLPETFEYMMNVSLEYRKGKGQFFTPKSVRERLLSLLPKIERPKIMDPACGTGEFLLSAKEYFGDAELYGWDIDDGLVEIAQKLVPEACVEKADALIRECYEKFDFVIGNPPYYEFKPDVKLRRKIRGIISGRVNVYALFVWLGIKLLREGGFLAYVVSPSMNNGAFFAKLRRFIVGNTNIEYMAVLDSPHLFEGALQSVMLLVLKKGPNEGDYIFEKNGVLIFSEKADYLNEVFKGKTTLYELGYKAATGRVVWNQNKQLLTDRPENAIPLIWAHNITADGLKLGNHGKPQYIRTDQCDAGPAIVVNRVVGRPRAGTLRAALIPQGMRFLGENHVNVIFPPKEADLCEVEYIADQINLPEKQEIVRSITGNTQISKNELEKLFPIDINEAILSNNVRRRCLSKGSLSLERYFPVKDNP